LHYYWPYGHFGVNFHPPLSGQLSLLTNGLFGWMTTDIVGRRLASLFEFVACVMLIYGFISSRFTKNAAMVAAGALFFMPRPFGDAHVAGTDMPGMLLWALTAIAFWKGLYDPQSRRWRWLVGVLLGLAFVQKMAAVFVVGPLAIWVLFARCRTLDKKSLIDGLFTLGPQLLLLAITFLEIRRLSNQFPPPGRVDLFTDKPAQNLPDLILAAPFAIWLLRQALRFTLGRRFGFWSVDRPTLETISASAAFAPLIGWLGNPGWWSPALPRLAHYYQISTGRQGALPDIQILYFGKIYEYALPWHNGFVLVAITVPLLTLLFGSIGLVWGLSKTLHNRLPAYLALHMLIPILARMFRVPAHDGVRLMLPVFFFLAAFAGLGADFTGRLLGRMSARLKLLPGLAVVLASAFALIQIHPYELSYYNSIVGGPLGAWKNGFELSYWYDAFTPEVLAEINQKLPENAEIQFSSELSMPSMVMTQYQDEGRLRPDILLGGRRPDQFPFMWLLTHDSKADFFTRGLYVMKPWYESRPKQLGQARVLAVMDPAAVSRAWALQLMCDAPSNAPPPKPQAPAWVQKSSKTLARFWGDGLDAAKPLTVNEPIFQWAQQYPQMLRETADEIVQKAKSGVIPNAADSTISQNARALLTIISRYDQPGQGRAFSRILLGSRPEGLTEAVEILIKHREKLRQIYLRSGYTDPEWIGGPVDGP
jgi:4-amino-4-deoxy-L-arabinose transferase-like glycosyltransferase